MGLRSALTAPALVPWAAATALHPRWRRDWAERWSVRRPPVQPGSVWIHGASVGEVGAALALAEVLPHPVLLTADTDTGARVARQAAHRGLVAGVRPVDHPWVLAPLWAEARPRAVVLVEGTWWPALARLAHEQGVPLARVSTRLGRSLQGVPTAVARRWFAAASVVIARSADDEADLSRVHAAPVHVGGDLKAARTLPPSPLSWSRPFVVAASSRGDDDDAWVQAARQVDPNLQVLVSPRRTQRASQLLAGLAARGLRAVLRSSLPLGVVPVEVDVVVLDTLGELPGALRGAAAVFVGGTFDPDLGGHSPLEARLAGVPIVAGPARHAQAPDAFQGAVTAPARDDLPRALREALRRGPEPAPSSDAARRTAELLAPWLTSPAPERPPRPWALPATAAVAVVSGLRNASWDRGWRSPERVDVPVISVGSTNARSPGRTSTVRWTVGALQARGHVVGVALRGYRRSRPGRDLRLSTSGATAADLGDEGALLAAAGALVAAGPDRVAGARALVGAGATIVVLDDGLQHRRLHRDQDWVVIDARYPTARGLLPAGERRELHAVPARAHRVIVHHGGAGFDVVGMSAVRHPGPWHPAPPPPGPVAAFCGIGRPADFLSSLEMPVARFRALADHQPMDEVLAGGLLDWAGPLPLVCTAKDEARLPPSVRRRVYWRDVELQLPQALVDGL